MKNGLLFFLAGVTFSSGIAAQSNDSPNRWRKKSFISTPSSTLNGVKSLANWIWDSGNGKQNLRDKKIKGGTALRFLPNAVLP